MFVRPRFGANLRGSWSKIIRQSPSERFLISSSSHFAVTWTLPRQIRHYSIPASQTMGEQDASGKAGARTVNTTERINALRLLLRENQVDAYVVVSEDQHSSEYLADCDARRAFISGFDGSAGCAVVSASGAFLFTDGRYFLQAEQQLDSNWTLMKQGLPGVPTWQEFLAKKLPEGTKIGIDPTLISISDATSLRTTLAPRNSSLVPIAANLIDKIWASRPPRPAKPIHPLSLKYAGTSPAEKLSALRAKLARAGATGVVISLLDEVAWLVGMRGADIDYNPGMSPFTITRKGRDPVSDEARITTVFFAYAIVTPAVATLFVNSSQLTSEAQEILKEAGWEVDGYENIIKRLEELGSKAKEAKEEQKDTEDDDGDEMQPKGEAKGKVLIDSKASLAVAHALGEGHYHVVRSSVADAKSIKNTAELDGFRNSHIRDGVALARYFAHLEEHLSGPEQPKWSEYQAAQVLERYRSELELFKGLSFTTISSTGPNGAIIHYSPAEEGSAEIKKDQIYLCDSGAQFLDGTTDVTRTWVALRNTNGRREAGIHSGSARPYFDRHSGLPKRDDGIRAVSKGCVYTDFDRSLIRTVIAMLLRGAHFGQMDSTIGMFRHGKSCRYQTNPFLDTELAMVSVITYAFMKVHRVLARASPTTMYTKLKEGMVLSNEPGYYADGKFGIRIESIVLVRKVSTLNDFGSRGYLGFEHVTMCPIHTKLVEVSLLNDAERKWLNDYHAEVLEKVGPELARVGDLRAQAWLERECTAI
ncbi:unnamed protein product [Rhizoctonia solani]|uniref:Xaa-Pro aminopeptidase P n=1 Tax=Rhizoctonia solani TaxID=456999 RepID=A0A8H3GS18_9AGAM|nr:unnamed protein product [Rhizoctonia solani]